jgi:hypothetical protein
MKGICKNKWEGGRKQPKDGWNKTPKKERMRKY